VVGYINRDTNLVDKVQTWLDNEFFGDMLIDADYLYYRDNNGLKYPAQIVQKRADGRRSRCTCLARTRILPTFRR
jgi:hypothetical protein